MKITRLIACIVGNVIEWYEFTLFVALSPVIASNFFPTKEKSIALLYTFLIFAIGFFIRPLGALVLGHFGDRVGRAKTLKFTIYCISLSSLLLGCLPTYAMVGMYAPMLLILCRLMQGLCIGGEFAGAMIYLSESAPNDKRALFSSMTNNGSNIGVLLAMSSAMSLSLFLSHEQFYSYGWRVLFFIGAMIGVIGLRFRMSMKESTLFTEFNKQRASYSLPIKTVLKHHKEKLFALSLFLVISACGSYTIMNYLSTYMHLALNMQLRDAYVYQTGVIALSLFLVPTFAVLADKIGRKPVIVFACVGYLIFAFPVFSILQYCQHFYLLIPLVIFYSAEQAVMPIILSEFYPIEARYTGISLAYNITMALVGGTSAFINTTLMLYFDSPLVIAFYIMSCSAISLIGINFFMNVRYGKTVSLSHQIAFDV